MSHILLEVCIASAEDALAAQSGGADRVELNSALALGGLTPSLGLLLEVCQAITLPVIAMARPRPSGFAYSAMEFRTLQRDLDLLLAHGARGIAFGVLHPDGQIDVQRCGQLVRQIGSAQAVFHRAFDVTPNPLHALELLCDLGVTRIMTSGQEASASAGLALIAQLFERAAGRIEILPAGGLHALSVQELLASTPCTQVHASLRAPCVDPSTSARPQVRFGSLAGSPEDQFDATSLERVRAMRQALGRDFTTEETSSPALLSEAERRRKSNPGKELR